MPRTALFRADASPSIGGGHVRRCLVLADALQGMGWKCTFATAGGSTRIVPDLARSGHDIVTIEPSAPDEVAAASKAGVDLLVIDHYGLDAEFEKRCRTFASRIFVIDDLATRSHDCDVLLDPTLGRTAAHYRALVSQGTELLLGSIYALMDPRFFQRRLTLQTGVTNDWRAFVSFGAADPENLTGRAIAALRMTGQTMRIDVAVGAANPNAESLRRMAAHDVAPANIAIDSDDIPGLMAGAHIAIGAGGGMGWERCCLGLPSLVVTIADNQSQNAAALERAGAARWLGKTEAVSTEALAKASVDLLRDAESRQAMRNAALAVTDGLGANRTVTALADPIEAKDHARISLRPATDHDRDAMFAWQTAPGARQYSRNPLPPSRTEHEQWFRAKLSDPGCVFNVIQCDKEPAGVLRFDWREDALAFEVSILIAANRQGLGVAASALALGRRLLPDWAFVADVDPENAASVRLFEKAGYQQMGQRMYGLPPFKPQRAGSRAFASAAEVQ